MSEEPKTPKPIIEQSTNYAFALQQLHEACSFWTVRDTSIQFFNMLPEKLRNQLYDKTQRGVCPLDSEPCLNTYMFALGKMHNAKLRKAYDHLSPEFLQHETIDIVDYGCGQAMGCICYADFLREKGIRQKVRRVVLIEPSELSLKRAALHVSLMFPDAELRTVCKGFDDLLPEDLCSDTDTPTLHILSNVLDIGDRYYDLDKFADLVANTIRGYNEFVCVEPLFCTADIDTRPARFFERLQIEPYFRFSAGKGEFVQGQTWTCALLLGTADNGKLNLRDLSHKRKLMQYHRRNILSLLKIHAGKWEVKSSRPFSQEEIDAVSQAVVVDSTYGMSVQFTMKGGGITFIPLAQDSTLGIGEEVDLTKAKVLTLSKSGERDIFRVLVHEGLAKIELNGKLGLNTGKWKVKSSRPFSQEEINAVSQAVVVDSTYGMSVQFTMKSGGITFIPLAQDSTLGIGEEVDLTKAKVLTLFKSGENDIVKVSI